MFPTYGRKQVNTSKLIGIPGAPGQIALPLNRI